MTEIEHWECDDCPWNGEADELVFNEANGKHDKCPRCGNTNFNIETEEVPD